MFTRIDHVGIACFDLQASIEFYRRSFGFELVHQQTNDEQGVREALLRLDGNGDVAATYVQLLEPTRADSPVGKFLQRHGAGLHHIAFGTTDVRQETEILREAGSRVVVDSREGTAGSVVSFLHPGDCGGVLVELVQPAFACADGGSSDRQSRPGGDSKPIADTSSPLPTTHRP